MKSVAVYCGSSMGASETYKTGAVELGKELARRNITLVYGGSQVGIMGIVADTVLQEGGQVIGVMPKILFEKELAHTNLTKLYVVESMHERKAKMAELADGFVALPGGPGTLEEFFEVFTWAQIGIHEKPCGLLNINNYYEPLLAVFDHMLKEEFLHERFHGMTIVDTNPASLLDRFVSYSAPSVKVYSK